MASPEVTDLSRLRIPREERTERTRRKRRRFPTGTLVFLLLVGVAGYLAWPKLAPMYRRWKAPEVRVDTVILKKGSTENELTTAAGYVVPRTKAALAARLAGRLVRLDVDVGSIVEKGVTFAQIDPATYRHVVNQHEARVAQLDAEVIAAKVRVTIAKKAVASIQREISEAEAFWAETEAERIEAERVLALEQRLSEQGSGMRDNLEKARNDVRRLTAMKERRATAKETLLARQASAEAEILGAESRVTVAEKSVLEEKERLETAKIDLADTEIKAPFRGYVLRKEAELGEIVVPALAGGGTSRGAVVSIADFDSLEMEVDVFERDLAKIIEGSDADIEINAFPDLRLPGRVRQIVPTADRTKGTVQVKVEFKVRDTRVIPDLGGKVIFLSERPKEAQATEILAPKAGVVTREGQTGAFVVENSPDGRRVRFRPVTVLTTRTDRVVIQSGLEGGELIVVDPAPEIIDGSQVKIPESSS